MSRVKRTASLLKVNHVLPQDIDESTRYLMKDAANVTDFERKYPVDPVGREADPNARVWRVYQDRVTEMDGDTFSGWTDTINFLLVFAGLFSAVMTAFLIELSKQLQPDYSAYTSRSILALIAQMNGSQTIPVANIDSNDFIPPISARTVNALWYGSLTLSLVVSMLAILAKQWIGNFVARMRAPVPNLRHWAIRHRTFRDGIDYWHLNTFISSLSIVLHVAVFLFLIGLAVYLYGIDKIIFGIVGGLVSVAACLYAALTIMPLYFGTCPTVTPLLVVMRQIFNALLRVTRARMQQSMAAFDEAAVLASSAAPQAISILGWMSESLAAENDIAVAVDAVASLEHHCELPDPTCWSAPRRSLATALDLRLHQMSEAHPKDGSEASACARALRTALVLRRGLSSRPQNLVPLLQVRSCDVHILAAALSISGASQRGDRIIASKIFSEALLSPLSRIIHALEELERCLAVDQVHDLPVPAESFALWAVPAADYLLSNTEYNKQAVGPRLELNQLAMLLLCIIYTASNSLAHDRALSKIHQRSTTGFSKFFRYEASYAQRILRKAVSLISNADDTRLLAIVTADGSYPLSGDLSTEPWIIQSLLFWGSILEDPKILGEQRAKVDLRTVRAVYTRLLAHLSTWTLPSNSSLDLNWTLSSLDYLTTLQFAAGAWSGTALLGPFSLLEQIASRLTSNDGNMDVWVKVSTLLAHLFAYVANHGTLVRQNPLAQCMSHIVEVIGKHRSVSAPVAHCAGNGQLALLRMPPPPLGLPSVWQSACYLRQVAPDLYNAKMFPVAIAIAFNLRVAAGRSQEQRSQAEHLLAQLLQPDGAVSMLREEDGRILDLHVRSMSHIIYQEAQKRLGHVSRPLPDPPQDSTAASRGLST